MKGGRIKARVGVIKQNLLLVITRRIYKLLTADLRKCLCAALQQVIDVNINWDWRTSHNSSLLLLRTWLPLGILALENYSFSNRGRMIQCSLYRLTLVTNLGDSGTALNSRPVAFSACHRWAVFINELLLSYFESFWNSSLLEPKQEFS